MKPFERIVNPGSFRAYNDCAYNVFVKIQWDGKRLSITGVEGPKRNGDAWGSCGQISLDNTKPAEGWAELLPKLADIWKRWHLNDMRSGCEHQRAEGWDRRPIDSSKPLNAYGKHYPGQVHDSWNMLSWVTRAEHSEGLLSHPCPVCGYKFGSAWLHEDVPEDVLSWLQALPETDITPAWV